MSIALIDLTVPNMPTLHDKKLVQTQKPQGKMISHDNVSQSNFELFFSKPSLKIRTASTIFWDYLGMFRDYGQKNIFF